MALLSAACEDLEALYVLAGEIADDFEAALEHVCLDYLWAQSAPALKIIHNICTNDV